jgi:tetratricopeptide (TPR) repeat protein
MNILSRFGRRAALCGAALLLSASFAAVADEVQDITSLYKQKKNEQALTRVDAYLKAQPKDAQARFLKGLILTEQDKTGEAIRVFSDLIEDYPELPEPYNNLAVLYAGQGQYDKAKMALEMAIRAHPGYATAHENLGDIYAMMASQSYERALQLDHGSSSIKNKLAKIREITSRATGEKSAKAAPSTGATAAAPSSGK